MTFDTVLDQPPPTSCSVRALHRGDSLLGTAFPAARLLLVEQPGPWGRRGLRDSRFPAELAAALESRVNAAGIRLQTIRRPGRSDRSAAGRWALVDSRRGADTLRWGRFEAPADLLDLAIDGSAGETSTEPVYLVCTHGGHDPCCAVRGRVVADALVARRPGQVWETTHLGGDRFAANVLVLPTGLLYGQVTPDMTSDIVVSTDAGTVITSLLRGQIGLPPAQQAALAYAHDALHLDRRADVHVTGSSREVDGVVTVGVDTVAGAHTVTVEVRRVAAAGLTCANPRDNVYLDHRPVAITPDR